MNPEIAVHMWDIIVNEQRYTPRVGELVLDLGAWQGHFTLYCASRGAFVKAYEPVPTSFHAMAEAVKKEPCGNRVRLINKAITDYCGARLIYLRHKHNQASSLSSLWGGEPLLIETERLETALDDRLWDCVKVDIEGAEYEVFAGADLRLLKQIRYLTMELHNDILTKEEHDALLDNLRRGFPVVNAVDEMRDGAPTGRICKVFATNGKWEAA